MSDDGKSSVPSPALAWCGVALAAAWVLIPTFGQMASAATAGQVTLQVEAPHGLPGLHHSALARFIAAHMAREHVSLDELRCAMREHGIADFHQVAIGVLEVDGSISFLRYEDINPNAPNHLVRRHGIQKKQ